MLKLDLLRISGSFGMKSPANTWQAGRIPWKSAFWLWHISLTSFFQSESAQTHFSKLILPSCMAHFV